MANDINNGLNIISGVINQNYSGQTRLLTPLGGALVREYTDVVNAAVVGGIEIGTTFNCSINTTTGAWQGRDIADICWLEKWSDTGGTKQYWYAPTAAAGVAPVWVLSTEIDLINSMSTLKKITHRSTSQGGNIEAVKYSNLASYSSGYSLVTGTLVIDLGVAPVSNMGTYVIQGYNYANKNALWRITVSGYNYIVSNTWINTGFILEGTPPFDPTNVRLGFSPSGKSVILLGITTSTWAYPTIFLEKAFTGYSNTLALKNATQSIYFVTSEAGYTNISTAPNLQGTLYQRFSGVTAVKTPLGGAAIYEYADILNAGTVGAIEVGTAYNAPINTANGVWQGRDVSDICWLEKWSDVGGLKEIWIAPAAAAGTLPVWTKKLTINATTGDIITAGAVTATGPIISNSSSGVIGSGLSLSSTMGGYTWGGATAIGAALTSNTSTNSASLDLRRWVGSGTVHHSTAITQINSGGVWEGNILFNSTTTNAMATVPVMKWNSADVTVLNPLLKAPSLVSTVANGTPPLYVTSSTPVAGLNTTGNAGSSDISTRISSRDITGRVASAVLPITSGKEVRYDFATGSTAGNPGSSFAGVMTYAPWSGTALQGGSQSYQMSYGSDVQNTGTIPVLNIRNGIDSTWNAWYTLLHSGNYNNYTSGLTGTATGLSVGGSSGSLSGPILGDVISANSNSAVRLAQRVVKGVARYNATSSSVIGAIVLDLGTPYINSMRRYVIRGYNYAAGGGEWEVVIAGYDYAGTPIWTNTGGSISGKAPFSTMYFASNGSTGCVILGEVNTSWTWPQIEVDGEFFYTGGITAAAATHSISVVTALTGYTNITPVIPSTKLAGSVSTPVLISTVANGTPPLQVTSSTPVPTLSIGGNANTATTLQTARTINGVAFNGSTNITIADSTKAPLTGTGASGTWGISISGNAATATNATTATTLQTARTINGVAFNGSTNITVADSTKAPLTGTGASGTWGISISGNAATATTATAIGGGVLGSLPYQSAANATALLAGNTTATKKFLTQTGTGIVSAAPSWGTLSSVDVGLGNVDNIADASKAGLMLKGTIPGAVDLNTYATTGIYTQTSNANAASGTNYPVAQAGILEVINNTDGNNVHTVQRYSQYLTNTTWVRSRYTTTWQPWVKLWTSDNDGSGSGLDADLLDGLNSSAFATAAHTHTGYAASVHQHSAADLTSGIVPNARISGAYSGITTLDVSKFRQGKLVLVNNDGYGNSNVCFNHDSGIPVQGGSSARIRTDTDSTSAGMHFQLADNVSAGVLVTATTILGLTTSGATVTGAMAATSFTGAGTGLTGTATSLNIGGSAASLGGVAAASYALKASPNLTGVPTAPTAAPGTNTTQIATTAFVTAGLATASGGPVNNIFYENDSVISTSYTITAGKNAMTAGPVTINNGVIITVPSGSTWTIV